MWREKVAKSPKNANANVTSKYKKGEIKDKKIIIDSLRDHLITYVSKLKKSKEMYEKLIGMYEVKNLSHIISLKSQLSDIKMSNS